MHKNIASSQELLSKIDSLQQQVKNLETINRELLREEERNRAATELERLQTAKALDESEERFGHILESSPMGIHMYNLESGNRLVFIGANPAAEKILGIDHQPLYGKTIEAAFPSLAETDIPNKYRRAAREGIPWQTEQITYRDEKIMGAFEVYAFQTQPNAMAVMFLDITERKQIEEDLNRFRVLHCNIINYMPSILIGFDHKGLINQWNREAEIKTGISFDEAMGNKLVDVLPHLQKELDSDTHKWNKDIPIKLEKIKNEKDGMIYFSDITVYPLQLEEKGGAVIRIDDVTERVRLEEMMIQSEKMVSVGGLAAGMAHEINNPLAGILQNTQVMQNRIKAGVPRNEEAAVECGTTMKQIATFVENRGISNMLDSILESGKRAAKIVQNMLSFSRKSESKFACCSIAELLDKTLELASNDYDLKKQYDFRRIKIVRQYHPDTPKVMCETTKIQQVFLNIIKNGAQAMASKWTVGNEEMKKQMLETLQFVLRVVPDNDMVQIEIQDNGPGMDKNTQKRAFEPFFTTKDVGEGTGLGLSVSYFIITENHHGTLTVNSSPGQGTTFIIRLPIKQDSYSDNPGGTI
jgi:PAS domain S-box-containing protein